MIQDKYTINPLVSTIIKDRVQEILGILRNYPNDPSDCELVIESYKREHRIATNTYMIGDPLGTEYDAWCNVAFYAILMASMVR